MSDRPAVRLFLCECGPIIKDAIDLDRLQQSLVGLHGVEAVVRYPTLCSPEGRAWMQADLQASPGSRVVVAGCSPREHEATFMDVLRASGSNPYLLAMANVREQCTWVTRDASEAGAKALALIRAAVGSGAILGGGDEDQIETVLDYGRLIGLAFQIQDDILDIEGDAATLGKVVGADARLGKATYPALMGLDPARDRARDLVARATELALSLGVSAEPLAAVAGYIVERRI